MPKNMQLMWIAEAEARRFEQLLHTQHAASEPRLSVVSAMRDTARRARWHRLMARLGVCPEQRACADGATPAFGAESRRAEQPVPALRPRRGDPAQCLAEFPAVVEFPGETCRRR